MALGNSTLKVITLGWSAVGTLLDLAISSHGDQIGKRFLRIEIVAAPDPARSARYRTRSVAPTSPCRQAVDDAGSASKRMRMPWFC